MRSPNNWCAIYITHQDVSGPSLPGYSLDALCWAWLGWVVASQGIRGDWLEPTHACLEIQPLSPVFLSLLHPTQHSAGFIQLTHEEILHKRKKLPAPMTGKKKNSQKRASKKRERAQNQRSRNKTKRKVRNRCRSAQSKSSAFVFVSRFI